MNSKQIKGLLQKYYDGESSIQEEQVLYEFFSQPELPPALQHEATLFRFYQAAKEEQNPKKLNLEQLDLLQQSEKTTTVYWIKRSLQLAASLLLISMLYYFIPKEEHLTVQLSDATPQETAAAYQKTKKALLLVSEKLNRGTKDVNKLSKFNQVQHLITTKTQQ